MLRRAVNFWMPRAAPPRAADRARDGERLSPSLNDWLPEDHLAFFIRDVVGELDLSAILKDYEGSKGGHPPYDPRMMVRLLPYAYCVGVPSSRKIEKASHESIPFRVISANQHPDHDTICEFRKRHLSALSDLFVQVLSLCRKAGLVKLGHVALDGVQAIPAAGARGGEGRVAAYLPDAQPAQAVAGRETGRDHVK